MFYTTLAFGLIWLLTLIKLSLTLSDKKRLKKSLSELYAGHGKEVTKLKRELEASKTRMKFVMNGRRNAEMQVREQSEKLIHLMFTQGYRCTACGKFIKAGMAMWDMKEMKPYCIQHDPLKDEMIASFEALQLQKAGPREEK